MFMWAHGQADRSSLVAWLINASQASLDHPTPATGKQQASANPTRKTSSRLTIREQKKHQLIMDHKAGMDAKLDDTQSLSGTTIAGSTFSGDTIVPAKPSHTQLAHRFYKGNGLSSKATVRSTTGKEYLLVADIHRSKPSSMQIFDGKDLKKAPSLGTLTFPDTHNNFQIDLNDLHQISVRARVGHPHPSSYNLSLPASGSSGSRSVSWIKFGRGIGYHLREEGTNVLIASWYLTPEEKYQAVLRWHIDLGDEAVATAVLLSYIGGLTRLKLKGKDDSERPSSMARWNGMWFMAIMGTAAVA